MIRALLAIALLGSPALAQVPTVKPPTMKPIAPVTVKPANPEIVRLQKDLKQVDAKIATLQQAQKERDRLKDKRDSISELGQDDMLAMQQLMQQKSQLETMISNVMKASSDSQSTAQNLKAS